MFTDCALAATVLVTSKRLLSPVAVPLATRNPSCVPVWFTVTFPVHTPAVNAPLVDGETGNVVPTCSIRFGSTVVAVGVGLAVPDHVSGSPKPLSV